MLSGAVIALKTPLAKPLSFEPDISNLILYIAIFVPKIPVLDYFNI